MSIRQPASESQPPESSKPPESGDDVFPHPETAHPAADPPLGRAWRIGLAVAVAVVVALGVVLFAALRDDPGPDTAGGATGPTPNTTAGGAAPASAGATPSGGSGTATTPAAAGPGIPAAGATGPHAASGPIGTLTQASLAIADSASTVTLTAADLGADLFRVQTPKDGALLPKVSNSSGNVTVRLTPSGAHGPGSVTMAISNKVAWRLQLTGSAAEQTLDLSGGRIAGLEFSGGSGKIDLKLPNPTGTMEVAITGGAGQVRIHTPRAAPASALLGGGAGIVTIDATTKQSVRPGTTVAAPDWAAAKNRYQINATAGVASLIVDRY